MNKVEYDSYYQKEDYFGKPYAGLIKFFDEYLDKGKILDLGCGQGRDSIPLAMIGYDVVAVDHSTVGINQLNAKVEFLELAIETEVADIYEYNINNSFDIILLDSILHFYKNDIEKESKFLKRLIKEIKDGGIIVLCMLKGIHREEVLNDIISTSEYPLVTIADKYVYYEEADAEFRLKVIRKVCNN